MREAALSELQLQEGTLTTEEQDRVKALSGEIADLNEGLIPQYALVPKGTELHLPGNKTHVVDETAYLSRYAKELLGEADKATLLFDLNKEQLKEPESLPKGTSLKVPQGNALALIMFGALVLLLAVVGLGWVLQTPPTPPASSVPPPSDEQPAPLRDLSESFRPGPEVS